MSATMSFTCAAGGGRCFVHCSAVPDAHHRVGPLLGPRSSATFDGYRMLSSDFQQRQAGIATSPKICTPSSKAELIHEPFY